MDKKGFSWVRAINFLLTGILILSLLGCGTSDDKASGEETKEGNAATVQKEEERELPLYKVQILGWTPTKIVMSDETEIGKIIKDKFNIVFEFIPYSGDYRAKTSIMLASGDYPEMLRLEGNDSVLKYVQAGALINLEEYVRDSKFFKDRYKEQLPFIRLASGKDEIYHWQIDVPQNMEVWAEFNDIYVRSDALEKQGWPDLVTEIDYLNFLKQAKKDFPTTGGMDTLGMVAPFAEPWGMESIVNALYEKGGAALNAAGMRMVTWNGLENRFMDRFTYEYSIDSYRFLNSLYREGLLDKECFTDFGPQVQEKLNKGLPLAGWYFMGYKDPANQSLIKAGHPERQYVRLLLRSSKMVERNEKRLARVEINRTFDNIAITKNAAEPERLFELVDWAASEEGQILLQSGIENKHYTIKDGKRVPTQELMNGIMNSEYTHSEGLYILGFLGRTMTLAEDGIAYDFIRDPNYRDQLYLTDREREAYKNLGWSHSLEGFLKTSTEYKVGLSNGIVVDPNSELGALHKKAMETVVRYGTKLIMAKNDADFEKILQEATTAYNKLHPERIVDEANRMYKEQMEKIESLR